MSEPSGGRRGGAVKEQVRQLLDGLPEQVTWDELMAEVARRAEGGRSRELAAEPDGKLRGSNRSPGS